MKKPDFGQTITILANVGVILGIIFLGIEISQNTTSIEVGAYQELTAQISRINELGIEDPGVWTSLVGNQSFSQLDPEAKEKVASMFLLVARHGDLAFYQYERGMISQERLDSALAIMTNNLCSPNFRELWSSYQSAFVRSYRSYVNSGIADCE